MTAFLVILINLQTSNKLLSPEAQRPAKKPRVSGEAFRRVDASLWNNEIKFGLEDNSCKILRVYTLHIVTSVDFFFLYIQMRLHLVAMAMERKQIKFYQLLKVKTLDMKRPKRSAGVIEADQFR